MKQSRNLGFLKVNVSKVENIVGFLTSTSVHPTQLLSIYELLQTQDGLSLPAILSAVNEGLHRDLALETPLGLSELITKLKNRCFLVAWVSTASFTGH